MKTQDLGAVLALFESAVHAYQASKLAPDSLAAYKVAKHALYDASCAAASLAADLDALPASQHIGKRTFALSFVVHDMERNCHVSHAALHTTDAPGEEPDCGVFLDTCAGVFARVARRGGAE